MSTRFIHSSILACLLALPSASALAVGSEGLNYQHPDWATQSVRLVHSISGACMHTKNRGTRAGAPVIVHRRGCSLHGLSAGEVAKMAFFYDPQAERIRYPHSKLCVVPRGNAANPGAGHFTMLGDCKSYVAQFEYVDNRYLRHRSGKCLIPKPGRFKGMANVNNDASVVFGDDCTRNAAAWNQTDINRRPKTGNLVHRFSDKCVRPQGHRHDNNTRIELRSSDCSRKAQDMVFNLLPNGAIRHIASGKCIHPRGGAPEPGNNTTLVIHNGCSTPQLRFTHLPNGAFQHLITGRCIHPHTDSLVPGDGTPLVLYDGCDQQTAQFNWHTP